MDRPSIHGKNLLALGNHFTEPFKGTFHARGETGELLNELSGKSGDLKCALAVPQFDLRYPSIKTQIARRALLSSTRASGGARRARSSGNYSFVHS